MPSPTEITPAQLARLVGTPEAPVLVDVCTEDDFASTGRLIPSAFRHPFDDIAGLVPRLAGRKVVICCHKGLKLGQGAAAMLRTEGVNALSLEGGKVAWDAEGFATVRADAIPPRDSEGRTVWVTRHRPKIDRIACPWLIRRFVDPDARFLFVAPDQVMNVADRFAATPFDIPNVALTHDGDRCTFDTMLDAFGLDSEPLRHLATVVRAADTDRHDLAPEAAGLLAASLGLSRMFRDDLQQLDAAMMLYDAFYRWARDARNEKHDWDSHPALERAKA